MYSTDASGGRPAPREVVRARLARALHGGLVALFILAAFVGISTVLTVRRGAGAQGSAIRAPDDWYNLLRLSVAAFVVSAAGALVYRRPSSRPMVLALALGVMFLGLDTWQIWDQVSSQAGSLAALKRVLAEVYPHLPESEQGKWAALMIELRQRSLRLYCAYYLFYVFWTVVILYSGYLGRYIFGNIVAGKSQAERESALYVAENAGLGLLAGVVSGVCAIAIATGMAAFTQPPSYLPIDALAGTSLGSEGAGVSAPAGRTEDRAAPAGGPAQGAAPANLPTWGAAGAGPARAAGSPGRQPGYIRQLPHLQRLRTYALFVVLAFSAAAYVTALVIRPRTSTWVACGATVGVMLNPLVTAAMAGSSDYLRLLPRLFCLLELSPFTLTGLAITAALVGDWAGRELLAFARTRESVREVKSL